MIHLANSVIRAADLWRVLAPIRERTEARRSVLRRETSPEIWAEGDDKVDSPSGHGRLLELTDEAAGVGLVHVGAEVELDELVSDRTLREDPELR